jgi:hypothetical protein
MARYFVERARHGARRRPLAAIRHTQQFNIFTKHKKNIIAARAAGVFSPRVSTASRMGLRSEGRRAHGEEELGASMEEEKGLLAMEERARGKVELLLEFLGVHGSSARPAAWAPDRGRRGSRLWRKKGIGGRQVSMGSGAQSCCVVGRRRARAGGHGQGGSAMRKLEHEPWRREGSSMGDLLRHGTREGGRWGAGGLLLEEEEEGQGHRAIAGRGEEGRCCWAPARGGRRARQPWEEESSCALNRERSCA